MFIESEKTADEILMRPSTTYVGIENVNANEIRKYTWQWESPEGEATSDKTSYEELLISRKFTNECVNAATGVMTDCFGFYVNEVQMDEAWFCPLRG